MKPERPIYRASNLGDLINTLPSMFGFPPENSLVVLGLRGRRIVFGMRLDLADLGRMKGSLAKAADLAVSHLEHQGVQGAIVLAVGEPLAVGRRLVLEIESRLTRVRPVAGGWARDDRYWASMAGADPNGYPYRRSLDHPSAVQAVVEGQQIAASRTEVSAAMAPITGARRDELEKAADRVLEEMLSWDGNPAHLLDTELWPTLYDLAAGVEVTDERVLRVAHLVRQVDVRDEAWGLITPDNARDMVRVWLHIARMARREWASSAYCLAGFAAWMCGDGAKALMATEHAALADPNDTLPTLIATLATSGVAPADWPWQAAS